MAEVLIETDQQFQSPERLLTPRSPIIKHLYLGITGYFIQRKYCAQVQKRVFQDAEERVGKNALIMPILYYVASLFTRDPQKAFHAGASVATLILTLDEISEKEEVGEITDMQKLPDVLKKYIEELGYEGTRALIFRAKVMDMANAMLEEKGINMEWSDEKVTETMDRSNALHLCTWAVAVALGETDRWEKIKDYAENLNHAARILTDIRSASKDLRNDSYNNVVVWEVYQNNKDLTVAREAKRQEAYDLIVKVGDALAQGEIKSEALKFTYVIVSQFYVLMKYYAKINGWKESLGLGDIGTAVKALENTQTHPH